MMKLYMIWFVFKFLFNCYIAKSINSFVNPTTSSITHLEVYSTTTMSFIIDIAISRITKTSLFVKHISANWFIPFEKISLFFERYC